mgnify:CR=1 FL=1
MKKLLLILFCLPLLIMAQAPQGFTYQGVATDNNGFELQNQTISIQASILSSSATGTTVWQETHTTSTDTFGLFSVVIGEGTSTNSGSSATFSEIDWGAASHFMKVEIDVNGGSNYVHVGTSQMMSVPYALYAKNINMDSVSDYLTNDSSFMANVGGGENLVESSDFENQTSNSDFNNNITGQIPQALDGKKVIIYSTDKTIYLTDSVGSFLSVLYSVSSNTIGNLTSNASGDTLYFLQSLNNSSSYPSIMMTSINNINPVAVGSVPCLTSELRQFKYSNGDFYYIRGYEMMKISNGNVTQINNNSTNCFTVNNLTVYQAYSSNLYGTAYSSNTSTHDLDYSPSEDRIYILRYFNGSQIGYWDLTASAYTTIFSPNGAFVWAGGYGEQVIKYNDGLVYFNQGQSLFSVQNDGNNSILISSSNDSEDINGIVPLVFNYQNVNTTGNPTTINVEDYIASNNKKIFYSTDKTIYLTDSVGSFLSVLYSVESNTIGNLTSNASGDTLYFLQSLNNSSSYPSIMMTSINNINPVAVGSVPCLTSELRQFKYSNGDFYYIRGYEMMKISNGNVTQINNNSTNCFTVNNLTVYQAYSSNLYGTAYSSNTSTHDLDYSPSEDRIYILRYFNGSQIGYWDLTASAYTTIFSPNGAFVWAGGYGEQVIKYNDGLVYFNQGQSLFSVQNDGNNSILISSSNDSEDINGVVIVD